MNHRMTPLYQLARKVSAQPIDWSNFDVARLQYEMRHDYVEKLPTLDLILVVLTDEELALSWAMTLTEILAAPEQVLA